ncbi:MAG: uracil-DNA glycosylase [Spirochaeta sp.]
MTESVWELLNDLEDYVRTGFRTRHPAAPAPAPEPVDPQFSRSAEIPSGNSPSFSSGADASGDPAPTISALADRIAGCRLCRLHESRSRTVPGTGVLDPLVCVVGEAPGIEEDRTGLPFVGPSGEYLDKWLKAIGLSRHRNVFITNSVKCRPPGNNPPQPDELQACRPYLFRQLELLSPSMVLILGETAAQSLSGKADASLAELRGSLHAVKGIPAVVTYHPSAVLRDQSLRTEVWKDLQLLRDELIQLRTDYTPGTR